MIASLSNFCLVNQHIPDATMPKPPSLYTFESSDLLAKSLRAYVLDAQNEQVLCASDSKAASTNAQSRSIERHQVFRVAVSGGSLPKSLAKALLAEGDPSNPKDKVDFSKWEIFYAVGKGEEGLILRLT